MDKLDLPFDKLKPEPEVWHDDATLKAMLDDIEKQLGWKCFLGSARSNLKLLLPIIQKHLKEIK
jgi:hypothetical protein